MRIMKGIAIDVTESLFDNRSHVILYVMKVEGGSEGEFIFSIPSYTFSVAIGEVGYEKELKGFFRLENLFRNNVGNDRLIGKMIEIIENWDEY